MSTTGSRQTSKTAVLRRPETLSEAVANHIRDAIIAGEFEPGAALPEIRLATELGTSRGTVREALRTLTDDGLVDIVPHRGSFVSAITPQRVEELYELRALLEPHAVRLAFDRGALATEEVRQESARLLGLMREAAAAGDYVGNVTFERDLHRVLWSACGNGLLHEFLSHIVTQTRRVIVYSRPAPRDLLADYEIHQALFTTVLEGTSTEAADAVRDHITSSRAEVLAKVRQREDERRLP